MDYDIRQILVQRLKHKGLEKNLIPGFLRSLANSIDSGPNSNFSLINDHMRHNGWDDIDLDYHTFELARNCELMLVVGTSAVVSPMSHMPVLAKEAGAKVLEINLEETFLTNYISDWMIKGVAEEILPKIVTSLREL